MSNKRSKKKRGKNSKSSKSSKSKDHMFDNNNQLLLHNN
jgi:hypothetical protein